MDAASNTDIRISRVGALAVIELTRTKALNALTVDMRAQMAQAIPNFILDPEVYALAIRSDSERAFCAGADVREICQLWERSQQAARQAFAAEYGLNWTMECFTKPTVSLMSGLVMGSGVGISAFGTHRVAGDGYQFAMPETAIGLFPDVGVAHVLARMPDEIGLYLGLTGRRIKAADAFALGLVTHCIPSSRFEQIVSDLSDVQPVDPLLDALHEDPGVGELATVKEDIARCFSAATMEDIVDALNATQGVNRQWALDVLAELEKKSPLSLKVTLKHLRGARSLTIRETLKVDYRLACSFLEGHDFHEGVRAALVDKDGAPRWQPATLAEVDDTMVGRCFEGRPGDELELLERLQMQGAHR